MPKLRTKSAIKKRFRVTKNGKVVRLYAGGAKLKAHKSRRTVRKYGKAVQTTGSEARMIKNSLGK